MKNQMKKLMNKLESANIPFIVENDSFDSLHLMYPGDWNTGCKCSVICHKYSYGHEQGLLEIMGLLTDEEKKRDNVVGYLTAKEVFDRIYNDYYPEKYVYISLKPIEEK